MARYRYAGPGPQEDGDGGLVRPGDVREFDAEPDWGPWELIDAPEAPQKPAPAPATPAPAPAPAGLAPASWTAPVTTAAPAAPKEQ